jgi:hypothetical protein
MSTLGSFASPPLAGCRQITLPLHLAAQSANRGLCVHPHQQLKASLNRRLLGTEPAPAHCLTHQLIIDFNVCPHALTQCVNISCLCVSLNRRRWHASRQSEERRANGEQRHFTPAARSDPAPFAARVLPHADAAPASPWWPELCPPRRQFLGRNSAAGDTNGGSATRR